MDKSCNCVVCDATFTRKAFAGNYQARYKLCDKCNQWHRWCPYGKHAPLLSRFSTNRDTHQHNCNDCLPWQRGRRLYRCISCKVEFLQPQRQQRLNGQGKPLCDDCYLNVKHCKRCDTIKPRSEFNPSKDKANGLMAHCRDCGKSKWHNSSIQERFRRQRGLKYGLTHEQYLDMSAAQGDVCAICGSAETATRANGQTLPLAIDHCHATGVVRALLCGNCNKALGCMADHPGRLRAAADYLESFVLITGAPTEFDEPVGGGQNAHI